jgi:hypothetical protein
MSKTSFRPLITASTPACGYAHCVVKRLIADARFVIFASRKIVTRMSGA